MFYTKSGALYRRTTNANKVSSYPATPITNFSCKVDPVQDTAGTGLESAPVYEVFQVFTDYMDVQSGDKIVIDSSTYLVK